MDVLGNWGDWGDDNEMGSMESSSRGNTVNQFIAFGILVGAPRGLNIFSDLFIADSLVSDLLKSLSLTCLINCG